MKATNNEELDNEEYSSYFPSFLWVVRDFTLQMCDENGDCITEKQYLENALSQQKGISDAIQNKNRVRRLVQSFFKDRDCSTMVRPLLDEGDLQNLDKTDLSKTRPEFAEQVLNLRKKILTRVKPKVLNGKI